MKLINFILRYLAFVKGLEKIVVTRLGSLGEKREASSEAREGDREREREREGERERKVGLVLFICFM